MDIKSIVPSLRLVSLIIIAYIVRNQIHILYHPEFDSLGRSVNYIYKNSMFIPIHFTLLYGQILIYIQI